MLMVFLKAVSNCLTEILKDYVEGVESCIQRN